MAINGVKIHNLSAAGDSRAMGGCEVMNTAANEVISEAGNTGDIKCMADLCLKLASKVIQRNQIVKRHGTTAFEIAYGRPARTVRDALTTVPETELLEDKRLEQSDYVKHVISMMKANTTALLSSHVAHRDETARRSAYTRDQNAARARNTEFDLRIGQQVSYENSTKNQVDCKLMSVEGYSSEAPVTAMVELPGGKQQRVLFSDLRPAGSPRPALNLQDVVGRVKIGDFILYDSTIYGEERVCGGVVKELTEDPELFEVQVHASIESAKSWMPSWISAAKKQKNQKSLPPGYAPWNILVTRNEVMVIGELTETYRVTEDTWAQMRTKHLV